MNSLKKISGLGLLFLLIQCYGSNNDQREDYDVAAFYWPAYHYEPRLESIFPEKRGEWEIIYHAKPKEAGHLQPKVPLWGYPDESDPKVMDRKIDAAVSHGVNVFIFDWYWYEGRPLLEDCINNGFLKSNNDRMKFYIMWANIMPHRTGMQRIRIKIRFILKAELTAQLSIS